jgi:hypothetical protein
MADDLEEEFSVAPYVRQLSGGRTTEGKTAKDKGPGVETNFLLALLALLTDEQDGVESPGALGRDADLRENLPNGGEGGREGAARWRRPIGYPGHDSRKGARSYWDGRTGFGGATRGFRGRAL